LQPGEALQDLSDPQKAWDHLQQRLDHLLETVTQLRKANAEIMKENLILTNQARQNGTIKTGVTQAEHDQVKRRLEEALSDLSRIRDYIKKVETSMGQTGRPLPPL